jgi:MFS family permease
MSVRAMILQGGAARWADLRACMAEPDFAAYTAGHFASNIGFWMQRIAIGWLVWTLTGSKAWLGFVAFAELFPSLLSSFIGGELADRFSRPRLFFFGTIGSTTVSFLLFWWHFNGDLDVWEVTGLMLLLGVIAGINLPPRLSMPHELVPNSLLSSALAVNTTTFNLSRLLGPAVAAPMLWLWGAEAVFFAAFLANAVFVVSLGRIAWRRAAVTVSGPRAPLRTVLADLAREKVVVAVIVLQFAQGALVRPASEMFPAFADRVFDMGETALALLNAALGLGAIVGAFVLARPRSDRDALRTIMSTSLVLAISLGAFAVTSNLWVALLILVMHGAMMSGSNNAAMAYVQLHTPKERLGRVLAVYGIVFRVAPAIGALAFGLTAEVVGLAATTLAFAAFGLATTFHYWQTVVTSGALDVPRTETGGAAPTGLQARAAAAETR